MDYKSTLLATFPIVVVLTAIAGGILFFPAGSADIRQRASEAVPIATITPIPTTQPTETICSSLYEPVCGVNGITYDNACSAELLNISIAHQGACPAPLPQAF